MNDRKLNAILGALAAERYVPSERLIMRTRAAVRGKRLLQAAIVSSIVMQLIAVAVVVFLLAAPGLDPAARISGAVALFGYIGCVVIAALAARRRVVRFFERMERLMA